MTNPTTDTQVASEGLTLSGELIDRISENLDEPDWMRDFRRKALEQYQDLPVPSGANSEEWRRTDVTDLDFEALRAPDGSGFASEPLPERLTRIRDAESDRVALHLSSNSTPVHEEHDPLLEEKGVVVLPMSEAVKQYPDIVQDHFMTRALEPDLNKFSALHAAFWTGGTFVYVPRDVELDEPIELHNFIDRDGFSILDHTLVVVGPNSRVNIVETHMTEPDLETRALCDSAVEVFAKDGAQVDYSHIQNISRNYYDLSMRRGVAEHAATVNLITGTLGSQKAKTSSITKLVGEGAESYLYGVMLANGDQHIDSDVSTIHSAPYTTEEMLARGVVLDQSTGIFRGVIEMKKGSRKAKGSLHERVLMVGNGAQADAVPQMNIQENDVKAAHSASVGELDEKQLLYMQSRGISRERARRLIIFGFFEPILKKLPVQRVRQNLLDLIDEKLDESYA